MAAQALAANLGNHLQSALLALDEVEASGQSLLHRTIRAIQTQLVDHGRARARLYGLPRASKGPLSLRLAQLCAATQASFGKEGARISLILAIEDIALSRHQEIGLGLILHELLTNALKHAFRDGRSGKVLVQLQIEEHAQCRLVVDDDGSGCESEAGAGLALVGDLAAALSGGSQVRGAEGTTVEVWFPLAN